jgi:hypothetical protein
LLGGGALLGNGQKRETGQSRKTDRPDLKFFLRTDRSYPATLNRAAVQPEVNLHRELGVLDRAVQIASTTELDVAATALREALPPSSSARYPFMVQ